MLRRSRSGFSPVKQSYKPGPPHRRACSKCMPSLPSCCCCDCCCREKCVRFVPHNRAVAVKYVISHSKTMVNASPWGQMRRSQQHEGFQDRSPLSGSVRKRLLQCQGYLLQHSHAFPCATVRCVAQRQITRGEGGVLIRCLPGNSTVASAPASK